MKTIIRKITDIKLLGQSYDIVLSVFPILAVILTGYFVLYFYDTPLSKDTPFMYSIY